MAGPINPRVTLSQIAELSGVSRPLVSAILSSGHGGSIRFSQETHDKVLRVAALTGYRPNRTARSLRSQRHGNIGVLVRRLGSINSVVLNLMQETASADYGQCLILGRLVGPHDPPGKPPIFLTENFVDGIVVIDHVIEDLAEQIMRLGVPSVWLNTGVSHRGALNHDEAGAMAAAHAHFLAGGRRHLGILIPCDAHYSHTARVAMLRQLCQSSGCPEPVVHQLAVSIYDREHHPAIARTYTEWLARHPQLDGVVLSSDIMVGPLYSAAAACGRQVPGELAVIGFNDSYVATAVSPQLTSLTIDYLEAGRQAVHLLNAFIDGHDEQAHPPPLPYRLIHRASS
jgi:DNA-binding LacI/PurR family transcriptional regulator